MFSWVWNLNLCFSSILVAYLGSIVVWNCCLFTLLFVYTRWVWGRETCQPHVYAILVSLAFLLFQIRIRKQLLVLNFLGWSQSMLAHQIIMSFTEIGLLMRKKNESKNRGEDTQGFPRTQSIWHIRSNTCILQKADHRAISYNRFKATLFKVHTPHRSVCIYTFVTRAGTDHLYTTD